MSRSDRLVLLFSSTRLRFMFLSSLMSRLNVLVLSFLMTRSLGMVLSLNMSRCHSVMLLRLRARFGRMMLFRTVARLASLVLSLLLSRSPRMLLFDLLSRSGEMELSAWMSRFDGTVAIPLNGSLEENGPLSKLAIQLRKGSGAPEDAVTGIIARRWRVVEKSPSYTRVYRLFPALGRSSS